MPPPAGELHVEPGLRHRIVRNGLQTIGDTIGTAEGTKHAGQRARSFEVHAGDASVRVRRANNGGIAHAWGEEIVAETACAGG